MKVQIDKFNQKGRGVGLHPESKAPIEVIGALPHDVVRVSLSKKRKGSFRGALEEIVEASQLRIAPRCQHAPKCGGCAFQEMHYAEQLEEKQRRVIALFSSFVQDAQIFLPILGCADPWNYRNKMEFSFSQNREGLKFLGLILAGSKGHVFNLQECHLVASWFALVVKRVFTWWEATGLAAFRLNGSGTLRYLTLREGIHTQDKMVILTVSGDPNFPISRTALNAFVAAIQEIVGTEHLSIFLRVQQAIKGMPTQFYEMHLFGKDHIVESLKIRDKTFRFKISLSSFFQPNSSQAARLYERALAMTPHPKKCVLDLYAGTATLGIVFASIAEQVIAIELSKEAILDAAVNCEWNGITNVTLYAGDTGAKLKELKNLPGWVAPDLAIVDPPRSGLGAEVIRLLCELSPQEILYISCNPTTQALDTHGLLQGGYQIIQMQPVDQFPHTPHIENILLLKRL